MNCRIDINVVTKRNVRASATSRILWRSGHISCVQIEKISKRRIEKKFISASTTLCRFRWPRCLRCGSAAARWLELWLWIPPGAWPSVSCECCMLSGRGLCFGLITRTEESYRVCGVSECDREASIMRRAWPTGGCCSLGRRINDTSHERNLMTRLF